eukprot:scaffold1123_cov168-Amphora_coffeaeformis.AAC.43
MPLQSPMTDLVPNPLDAFPIHRALVRFGGKTPRGREDARFGNAPTMTLPHAKEWNHLICQTLVILKQSPPHQPLLFLPSKMSFNVTRRRAHSSCHRMSLPVSGILIC